MKSTPFYALLLLFSISWLSCRKDDDPTPTPDPVIAGVVDDSMHTYINPNPNPPALVWDSLNRYAEGIDSIDLDQDGYADIELFLRVYNPDSLFLITQGYPVPLCRLKGLGDWQVGYDVESIPMGMGAYMELDWTSKLTLGDTIDNVVPGFQAGSNLWMVTPTTASYGPWYSETTTRYVAIARFNGTVGKFGWLEITCPDREQIAVASWAYRY